jgi:hypothetical protein
MLQALGMGGRSDHDAFPPTEPLTLPVAVPAVVAPRAVWIRVDSGLHVASTAATFVGTVTETGRGFDTMDGSGRRRGTFGTLDAAKAALEACAASSAAAAAPRRLAPVA